MASKPSPPVQQPTDWAGGAVTAVAMLTQRSDRLPLPCLHGRLIPLEQ